MSRSMMGKVVPARPRARPGQRLCRRHARRCRATVPGCPADQDCGTAERLHATPRQLQADEGLPRRIVDTKRVRISAAAGVATALAEGHQQQTFAQKAERKWTSTSCSASAAGPPSGPKALPGSLSAGCGPSASWAAKPRSMTRQRRFRDQEHHSLGRGSGCLDPPYRVARAGAASGP